MKYSPNLQLKIYDPPPELPGEAMFGTIDCSHTTLQWAAHGAKGTVVRSEAEYAI